ncbi:MAG: manganese efflux pump MntP family protein [Chloroflexi bacterium]|nr:manganese efflux pump MntP family protein [Chloroflexota bacterium]
MGIGASGRADSWKRVLRVGVAFGVFQAGMPLLGWLVGQTVVQVISGYDHWVAFALLLFVGGRMIWEFVERKSESEAADISKWITLLTLSVATSIDALAVGLSFALLKLNILICAATIGIVAFLVTALGCWLGRRASVIIGRWALLVGGIILIGIGARILITHIVG